MFIVSLLYLALLILLVFGAVLFFVKALKSPKIVQPTDSTVEFSNRQQIIDQLERQFHSSPSSEL